MKKLLVLLLIIFGLWYFYNLGQKQEAIKNAKKDLLDNKQEQQIDNKEDNQVKKEENIVKENKLKPSFNIESLDNKNFIEVDDLSKKVEKIVDKTKITWKVLDKNVDKIVVKFSNSDSDFADDSYRLKTFKKWNSTFEYNADSLTFQNLDYGENVYLVEAYTWDKVSQTKVIINIPKDYEPEKEETKKEVSFDKKLIWDLVISLPKGWDFGDPLTLDDWKITYSNIKDLEITKDDFNKENLTSENIWNAEWTWYLNNAYSSYVYWNTFREIDYANKDAWVSFYVLRKSGDKLIYEKLYFDFKNNLKWVLKIKEFDVDENQKITEQMSSLNTELKEQNKDFEEVKKTDKLFKEMIR